MDKKSAEGSSRIVAEEEGAEGGSSLVRLWVRFGHFGGDALGVLCLALALMTLLANFFPQWTSGLLDWWAILLKTWFGWGFLWLVVLLTALGIWLVKRRSGEIPGRRIWGRILLLECVAFGTLALLTILGGNSLERADAGLDGGRVGWGLVTLLTLLLQPVGLASEAWLLTLVSLSIFISLAWNFNLFHVTAGWLRRTLGTSPFQEKRDSVMGPAVSEAPLQGLETQPKAVLTKPRRKTSLPPQFRKNFRLDDEAEMKSPPKPRDERLPPLDLLIRERSGRPDERTINMTAGLIEKTLAEFGIPAKVVGFRVGPTVTQFAVEPGYIEKDKANGEDEVARQKVRVAQISSLSRDITLALSAERLRIEAPVPGRPYVGIEVPNTRSVVVRLRPILESEAFYKVNSPLAITLGRDVSGQPVVADLGAMPHFLIAGTTGSGKSVSIAALTTCLVMNNTPEDLRLVMIDPKMVELVRFNGLPHLYGVVETNIERILAVLRWTVVEMDRRYKVLEASHSRNIDTYNRKAHRRKDMPTLPRLVVMIDELADLMMTAPDQTEHNLVRLAQMARAVGIHLVIATQRPSTDVVTGLIKANFPSRASFAVASSVDSRVILDVGGAENLLGRGDMLFLPPEAPGPIRVQGVMVSDQEVEKVITFWQEVTSLPEEEQPPWEEMLEQEQMLADRDDLLDKAVKLVTVEGRASASMLQRRLRVGYPRAARLIDELEEMGVIGPAVGGGREREVLIEPDDGELEE